MSRDIQEEGGPRGSPRSVKREITVGLGGDDHVTLHSHSSASFGQRIIKSPLQARLLTPGLSIDRAVEVFKGTPVPRDKGANLVLGIHHTEPPWVKIRLIRR